MNMRREAGARAAYDGVSDAELDEDGAEPSASDGARPDGRPAATRRHQTGVAPAADPIVVGRLADGPVGSMAGEATTNEECACAQPVYYGGGAAPMAVDSTAAQEAAAMRASDGYTRSRFFLCCICSLLKNQTASHLRTRQGTHHVAAVEYNPENQN